MTLIDEAARPARKFDENAFPNNIGEVNSFLKSKGVKETLVKGKGYYYFIGGNTDNWYEASVMTYRISDMRFSRWYDEWKGKSTNPKNYDGNSSPANYTIKINRRDTSANLRLRISPTTSNDARDLKAALKDYKHPDAPGYPKVRQISGNRLLVAFGRDLSEEDRNKASKILHNEGWFGSADMKLTGALNTLSASNYWNGSDQLSVFKGNIDKAAALYEKSLEFKDEISASKIAKMIRERDGGEVIQKGKILSFLDKFTFDHVVYHYKVKMQSGSVKTVNTDTASNQEDIGIVEMSHGRWQITYDRSPMGDDRGYGTRDEAIAAAKKVAEKTGGKLVIAPYKNYGRLMFRKRRSAAYKDNQGKYTVVANATGKILIEDASEYDAYNTAVDYDRAGRDLAAALPDHLEIKPEYNWIKTGGSFGQKRRLPGYSIYRNKNNDRFIVKNDKTGQTEGAGYKTVDDAVKENLFRIPHMRDNAAGRIYAAKITAAEVAKHISAGKEIVMWGLPKGKTDALHEQVMTNKCKTKADIDKVIAAASKDGWHGFTLQILNLQETPKFGANMLRKDKAAETSLVKTLKSEISPTRKAMIRKAIFAAAKLARKRGFTEDFDASGLRTLWTLAIVNNRGVGDGVKTSAIDKYLKELLPEINKAQFDLASDAPMTDEATGVKETVVYQGPEGTIRKQEMLSGTQYRTTYKNKNYYAASERGCLNWLKKKRAATQAKKDKAGVDTAASITGKDYDNLEKYIFGAFKVLYDAGKIAKKNQYEFTMTDMWQFFNMVNTDMIEPHHEVARQRPRVAKYVGRDKGIMDRFYNEMNLNDDHIKTALKKILVKLNAKAPNLDTANMTLKTEIVRFGDTGNVLIDVQNGNERLRRYKGFNKDTAYSLDLENGTKSREFDEAGIRALVLELYKLDEAAAKVQLDLTESDANKIKDKAKASFVNANVMKLGGAGRHSIAISMSLDSRENWKNGIFENSRSGKFMLNHDGSLEHISGSFVKYPAKYKFRKATVKSVDDAIAKLNKFIADTPNVDTASEGNIEVSEKHVPKMNKVDFKKIPKALLDKPARIPVKMDKYGAKEEKRDGTMREWMQMYAADPVFRIEKNIQNRPADKKFRVMVKNKGGNYTTTFASFATQKDAIDTVKSWGFPVNTTRGTTRDVASTDEAAATKWQKGVFKHPAGGHAIGLVSGKVALNKAAVAKLVLIDWKAKFGEDIEPRQIKFGSLIKDKSDPSKILALFHVNPKDALGMDNAANDEAAVKPYFFVYSKEKGETDWNQETGFKTIGDAKEELEALKEPGKKIRIIKVPYNTKWTREVADKVSAKLNDAKTGIVDCMDCASVNEDEARAPGGLDQRLADTIVMWCENDADTYKMMEYLMKSYNRKIKGGKYDDTKAVYGWLNIVNAKLPKFKKENPEYGNVSGETKLAIAKELMDRNQEAMLKDTAAMNESYVVLTDIGGTYKHTLTTKDKAKVVAHKALQAQMNRKVTVKKMDVGSHVGQFSAEDIARIMTPKEKEIDVASVLTFTDEAARVDIPSLVGEMMSIIFMTPPGSEKSLAWKSYRTKAVKNIVDSLSTRVKTAYPEFELKFGDDWKVDIKRPNELTNSKLVKALSGKHEKPAVV